MHIHGSNFISGAILGYKSIIEIAKKAGLNSNIIEKSFELLKFLPEEVQPFFERYRLSDVNEAFKNMQSLSSFEWCSDKKLLISTKKEIEAIVEKTAKSIIQGNLEKVNTYFQEDYLLKESSHSTKERLFGS